MTSEPATAGETNESQKPLGLRERREKLEDLIAAKLRQGYWVESQRDTDAVVASLGPHRWFGRVGPRSENGREAISVDVQGRTTIEKLPKRRY
jgi:hypothetical protein